MLGVIFRSVEEPSHQGDTLRCGDGMIRIGHPGILIESVDGEEAACFCSVFSANANHPCPKCLVHKSQLADVDKKFTSRTPELMRSVLAEANAAANETKRKEVLKEYGLHPIEVRSLHCITRS